MADIELVIKIPKEEYEYLKAHHSNEVFYGNTIANGTPLPEHHGRLIDADVVADGFEDNYEFCEAVNATPTIIPATKEKSCKNCKYGKAYEHGADITTMDDECGGCCSWNDKWGPKQTATKEGDGE